MRTRVTIGDFSRASHLSVKTLRHYHEVGLLEPSEVDPDNGYRYYSEDQIPLAQVIRRYFLLDAEREIDSIVGLFTDDATVVDEGETRHGTMEIRAWQTGPASKYTYTTDVLAADALTADRFVVTGRLTGNFPGGTAELKWDFTLADDRISQLVIAP